MFATIRQTFPTTRTMSDGRLTAIIGAAMLLMLSIADADAPTTAGIVAGAAVVIVLLRRARAAHDGTAAVGVCGTSDESVFTATPRLVRAEAVATAAPTATSDDVLLARAIALRDRVSVRR